MTSGGQYVMTSGTALMLLWSASNWDMHTLEVSMLCVTVLCEGDSDTAMSNFVMAVDLNDMECSITNPEIFNTKVI